MSATARNKTVYGECRFCFRVGEHRFIDQEYQINGNKEVYFDLVAECYSLRLSTSNSLSKLMCNVCIEQLRHALAFREVVLRAEGRLLDPLHSKDRLFVHVDDTSLNVIVEENYPNTVVKEEVDIDEVTDFVYEDSNNDYEPLNNADQLEAFTERNSGTFKLNMKLPASFKRHLMMVKDKIITAKDISLLIQDTTLNQSTKMTVQKTFFSEKRSLITNIVTILKHTNVAPFKSKVASGYPCFYCRKPMENGQELRVHAETHQVQDIKQVLWKQGPEALLIYVDITDLACKICDTKLKDVKIAAKHLTENHGKTIDMKCVERILPFKLDKTLICQCCDGHFETFGSLERHMNGHYRNHVCGQCGAGFVTRYRLKIHSKAAHSVGNWTCACGKTFGSSQKLKSHEAQVHRSVKRFKCLFCGERFGEYFMRRKHMVERHGAEPLVYKCNVCDKSFERRFMLSRHLKRDHLEERNHQCSLCAYRSYSLSELRTHMVKHVGARIHECLVCRKAYARKKTLKEHLRIHENDRRHVCPVCGQAFVQKCSLKGHVKTHHPDYPSL